MKANEERPAYITNSESLVTHIADLRSAVKLIVDLRSDQPPLPLRVDPAKILTRAEHRSVEFKEVGAQISGVSVGDRECRRSTINLLPYYGFALKVDVAPKVGLLPQKSFQSVIPIR